MGRTRYPEFCGEPTCPQNGFEVLAEADPNWDAQTWIIMVVYMYVEPQNGCCWIVWGYYCMGYCLTFQQQDNLSLYRLGWILGRTLWLIVFGCNYNHGGSNPSTRNLHSIDHNIDISCNDRRTAPQRTRWPHVWLGKLLSLFCLCWEVHDNRGSWTLRHGQTSETVGAFASNDDVVSTTYHCSTQPFSIIQLWNYRAIPFLQIWSA